MSQTSRSMKDMGAEGDLNCGGPTQELLEEKIFNMFPRDHLSEESDCLFSLFEKTV